MNSINYDKIYDILPRINLNKRNKNLTDIFESRLLYIDDSNLTKEYIHFIRPLNRKSVKPNVQRKSQSVFYNFKNRTDKLSYKEFIKKCNLERLINTNNSKLEKSPLISVILPSFNKEKVLMKSIRSIQNQSLKKIEIIIVDDCSTDNSTKYYKYLLETDLRIRVFFHLKNMGVWRSRLDGFLYSKGKYIFHFDTGDLFEDNYVLEDLLDIVEQFNLDSAKMLFRIFYNMSDIRNYSSPIKFKRNQSKIVYSTNIKKYDTKIFGNHTNIWNRLTKNEIYTKGLYLLSSYILNIYKNLWEDMWWNKIANKVSDNFLIIKRYGYLYFKDGTGEGSIKIKNEMEKDKKIKEFIHFLYFNFQLWPKRDNKKILINRLKLHKETDLYDFKTKFYILNNLLAFFSLIKFFVNSNYNNSL
jgi:glycosyltransferase involved in cell wall biosynthesis